MADSVVVMYCKTEGCEFHYGKDSKGIVYCPICFGSEFTTKVSRAGIDDAEINPAHPVTKGYHDQWHKLCMILLDRLGEEQVITQTDVELFQAKYPSHAILVHEQKDGVHLKAVTMEEAIRLGAT